jgi:solute carrier family 25 protein 38
MASQVENSTLFFCGSLSGALTSFIVQPLDVIKTNFLTIEGKTTIKKSFKFVLKNHGPLGFWKGLSPSVTKSFIGSGISFSLLEKFKILIPKTQSRLSHIIHDSLSAIFSRTLTTVLLNPLSVVKIRMEAPQTDPYRGMGDALKRIYKEEGFKGYYKGLGPTLLRDLPFSGLAYTFYRQYHHIFKEMFGDSKFVSMFSGGMAGFTATLITHPFDIIKTRNQFNHISKTEQFRYLGIVHAFKCIYSNEGLKGFTTGLSIRIIERTIAFSSVWFIYENLKHYFKRNIRKD